MSDIVPMERIEKRILMLRGQKIMLDRDLAELYGVTTGNLNKAVSRNLERFPEDFMFRLSPEEFENLKFHFGTSSCGGIRKPPKAFTDQGIAMLSSVLRSKKAIHVNIAIMRVFVKLKEMLSTHKELAYKLNELERKIEKHDKEISTIFEAIRQIMNPKTIPKKQI